jgi:hypothetical protein
MGTIGALSPAVKRLGREANHSLPRRAKVNNEFKTPICIQLIPNAWGPPLFFNTINVVLITLTTAFYSVIMFYKVKYVISINMKCRKFHKLFSFCSILQVTFQQL